MAEMQMTPEMEAKMKAMRGQGQQAPQSPEAEPPTLSERVMYLINAIRNLRNGAGGEPATRDVAEGASMVTTPGAAREAVLKKRQQMKMMDDALNVQ